MKKKHALLGIISILAGLLVAFVLTPIYNRMLEKQVDVVRVKKTIQRGEAVTEDKIEMIKVGAFNLSSEAIKDKDKVLNRYAKTDYFKGNYITDESLSDTPIDEDVYLNTIPDDKYAISVTIQSFAAGLSSKLVKGDVVAIITKKGEGEESITEIPKALNYVEVLSTTESSGKDKEHNKIVQGGKGEEVEKGKLATITLLVNAIQAEELASYEEKGVHIALKCRNNLSLKEKYLAEQERILKEIDLEGLDVEQVENIEKSEEIRVEEKKEEEKKDVN